MMVSLLAEGTLLEFITAWQIIVAMSILAVGIAISLLAHRFAKRGTEPSKVTKWRIFSLVLILIGLIVFIVGAAMLGGIF